MDKLDGIFTDAQGRTLVIREIRAFGSEEPTNTYTLTAYNAGQKLDTWKITPDLTGVLGA